MNYIQNMSREVEKESITIINALENEQLMNYSVYSRWLMSIKVHYGLLLPEKNKNGSRCTAVCVHSYVYYQPNTKF